MEMKKVSFTMTKSQYDELDLYAAENKLTITDAIINNLPVTKIKKLDLSIVIEKVERLEPDSIFTIPSLFEKDEWDGYDRGSKLAVGKQFYKGVIAKDDPEVLMKVVRSWTITSSGVQIIPDVEFLYKNSANLAQYKKIKSLN